MSSYFIIGSGYLGSPDIEISTSNMEVVPEKPAEYTIGYRLYKFSFMNRHECHVKVNGGTPIYLAALQGFNIEPPDKAIESFVVVESGILFNFVAAY